jgi:O-antigen ligase
MSKNVNKLFLYLFLSSVFLFKIPNFYIIPSFKSAFVTTQALARILLILVFCFQLVKHFLLNQNLFNKKDHRLIGLIIILFLFQSLTISVAINQSAFLNRYKDVLISLLAFFTFIFYKNNLRQIAIVLLASITINFLYQFIIIFYQDFFIKYLSVFVYEKHVKLVIAKLYDNKIYTDTYDEIILPLLFVFFQEKKQFSYLNLSCISIIILFFSFFSNIRTRVLMLLFSLGGSVLLFKKIGFKKISSIILVAIIMSISTNKFMRHYAGYSIVDRLLLTNENTDIRSLDFRWDQLKDSLEMGRVSLLGVGLGNYYDNLESKNNNVIFDNNQILLQKSTDEYIHNIFGSILVESGYISLFIFIFILFFFIINDIKLLKSNLIFKKAYVVAFWSIFIYGVFNPISPASFQVMFWGIRGLLI